MSKYTPYDFNVKEVEVKRNPKWEPLDWNAIKKAVGQDITKFDEKMCENQCPTTEMAIKAIQKRRECDQLQFELELEAERDAATNPRNKYIRTHYNDLEADNYERQEVRTLNG